MNIIVKSLPALIVLLAGCTTTKVVMKVDPALEGNSTVYKLKYPNSLADKLTSKRLNVSFGPYRVIKAKVGWTGKNSKAEDPDPFFTSTKIEKSGNVTTTTKIGVGPTEIFGFSRPAAEGEPTLQTSSQKITYKFKVGKDVTWLARCAYRAEKRVTHYQNTTSSDVLASNFTCQYKKKDTKGDKSDSGIWVFSADYGEPITMTLPGTKNTLTANQTTGKLVKSNGKSTKHSTRAAGYTWTQSKDGTNKNVAAISIREEKPRVWLDKRNSDSLNHILAMANTGLWVYSMEIQHQ